MYSCTIRVRPSTVAMSWTAARFWCDSVESAWASSRKSCCASSFSRYSSLSILMATGRSSSMSRARSTTPMPPRPRTVSKRLALAEITGVIAQQRRRGGPLAGLGAAQVLGGSFCGWRSSAPAPPPEAPPFPPRAASPENFRYRWGACARYYLVLSWISQWTRPPGRSTVRKPSSSVCCTPIAGRPGNRTWRCL